MVNGFDTLVITKLDVLDQLEEIPVCIGYRINGHDIHAMPATYRALESIEPVYRKLPGMAWSSVRGVSQLRGTARTGASTALSFWKTGRPVSRSTAFPTGPERTGAILRSPGRSWKS